MGPLFMSQCNESSTISKYFVSFGVSVVSFVGKLSMDSVSK